MRAQRLQGLDGRLAGLEGRLAGLALAVLALGCGAIEGPRPPAKTPPPAATPLALVDGPILGDPRADRVLVWARAEGPGFLHAQARGAGWGAGGWGAEASGSAARLGRAAREGGWSARASAPLGADHDFAATIPLALEGPADVAVWATEGEAPGKPPSETRRYAPLGAGAPLGDTATPSDAEPAGGARTPGASGGEPLRIAFGGDVAGQNVCRHATEGFAAFRALAERPIDLFIGLGDMIYADGVCEATGRWGQPQVAGDFGPGESREDYWAHWRYARADPHLRRLLARVPYVAVWDDHEVFNDFASDAARLPVGLATFRDHNPLPETLHRALDLGPHARLILLDTRQHRDPNRLPDSDEAPKTMLGEAQRAWLSEQLREPATWHLVVSSVPLAIPTGSSARDGWANLDAETGYERELRAVFEDARAAGARLVFLTTDVHFAAVHRLEPLDDYTVHEVVTGPLNAGLFPNRALDPTFRPERLFFHGPESAEAVTDWAEGRRWMNWGEVVIAPDGSLTLEVRDVDGEVLFAHTLSPPRS